MTDREARLVDLLKQALFFIDGELACDGDLDLELMAAAIRSELALTTDKEAQE